MPKQREDETATIMTARREAEDYTDKLVDRMEKSINQSITGLRDYMNSMLGTLASKADLSNHELKIQEYINSKINVAITDGIILHVKSLHRRDSLEPRIPISKKKIVIGSGAIAGVSGLIGIILKYFFGGE